MGNKSSSEHEKAESRSCLSREPLTQLLARASSGDRAALDEIVTRMYDELRAIAEERRARWRGDETLSTTVLVNEAYLRLAQQADPRWESRVHFKAVASTAMRQVLVDYGRRRRAKKRGAGAWDRVTIDRVAELFPALGNSSSPALESIVDLDGALERLEAENPDYVRLVECRFFGGMTIAETAEALDLSPATVKRRWNVARAWLHRALSEG
jgi:RNA polymerase sigma factor (TIGR02999 family)